MEGNNGWQEAGRGGGGGGWTPPLKAHPPEFGGRTEQEKKCSPHWREAILPSIHFIEINGRPSILMI